MPVMSAPENKLTHSVVALVVAAATAGVGVLWRSNGQLATLAERQKSATAMRLIRQKTVDQRVERIWQTDKDQDQRLEDSRRQIDENKRAIRALQTRVETLKRRTP